MKRDRRLAGGILVLSAVLLAVEISRWVGGLDTPAIWSLAGIIRQGLEICRNNVSIVLAVYVFLCMQVAGWIELRYETGYLSAFFITFLITPVLYVPLFLILRRRRSA
ncbi:MAG: hypothetical protein GXO90_10780 [FCB group bacterium]|nr:hypothetical protein [FCB group bacterium]